MGTLLDDNNDRIEDTILRNFFFNEDFTRKVLPFLKDDLLWYKETKSYFMREDFVNKYNNLPTKETILIELK